MNHNRKKIATIFLLMLALASFSIRHTVDDDDCLQEQAAIEYTLNEPNCSYSWEKIPVHALVVVVPVTAALRCMYIFICLAVVKAASRSHIEYCGKKMVKAIMLQFRPN